MRLIDPPDGWRYGFPKPFNPAPGQHIDDWLLESGYPQSEIDLWEGRGVPCRVWEDDLRDRDRRRDNELFDPSKDDGSLLNIITRGGNGSDALEKRRLIVS